MGAGEQLSEAAGTRDNAADIPAASLHSRVLLRLPLRVVSTGAMVSETEMVCITSIELLHLSVIVYVLVISKTAEQVPKVLTSLLVIVRFASEVKSSVIIRPALSNAETVVKGEGALLISHPCSISSVKLPVTTGLVTSTFRVIIGVFRVVQVSFFTIALKYVV